MGGGGPQARRPRGGSANVQRVCGHDVRSAALPAVGSPRAAAVASGVSAVSFPSHAYDAATTAGRRTCGLGIRHPYHPRPHHRRVCVDRRGGGGARQHPQRGAEGRRYRRRGRGVGRRQGEQRVADVEARNVRGGVLVGGRGGPGGGRRGGACVGRRRGGGPPPLRGRCCRHVRGQPPEEHPLGGGEGGQRPRHRRGRGGGGWRKWQGGGGCVEVRQGGREGATADAAGVGRDARFGNLLVEDIVVPLKRQRHVPVGAHADHPVLRLEALPAERLADGLEVFQER